MLPSLLGSTDEITMRYFILIVALLLDPAAVLLLLAATASARVKESSHGKVRRPDGGAG
jgi:hypothetical protein